MLETETMMLEQFIYSSTLSEEFSTDVLEDILDKSRANNPKSELTGVLIFNGQHFIQILEGDATSIETLTKKIEQDPRHKDIIPLSKTDITERSFPDWSMAVLSPVPEQIDDQMQKLSLLSEKELVSRTENMSGWIATFVDEIITELKSGN